MWRLDWNRTAKIGYQARWPIIRYWKWVMKLVPSKHIASVEKQKSPDQIEIRAFYF
jgi:hypothetical protein